MTQMVAKSLLLYNHKDTMPGGDKPPPLQSIFIQRYDAGRGQAAAPTVDIRHKDTMPGGDKPPPLQVNIHKGIFVFFFTYGCWFAMSWENHQIFIKRIELLANRGDDLIKVSALKIGATNAAIEQCITTKHAIWRAYEANTAVGMARGMQHLERQCAKGDAVPFFQQDIGFAL